MRSIVEPGVQQRPRERSRRQARGYRSDPEGGVVAPFESRAGQERVRRAQQLMSECLQPEHHCSTWRDQVLLVDGVRPCVVGKKSGKSMQRDIMFEVFLLRDASPESRASRDLK